LAVRSAKRPSALAPDSSISRRSFLIKFVCYSALQDYRKAYRILRRRICGEAFSTVAIVSEREPFDDMLARLDLTLRKRLAWPLPRAGEALECGGNEKPTLYQASRRHRFGRARLRGIERPDGRNRHPWRPGHARSCMVKAASPGLLVKPRSPSALLFIHIVKPLDMKESRWHNRQHG
jgi:hypothetical protein